MVLVYVYILTSLKEGGNSVENFGFTSWIVLYDLFLKLVSNLSCMRTSTTFEGRIYFQTEKDARSREYRDGQINDWLEV